MNRSILKMIINWLLSMVATTAIGIIVMIYGWGIQPQQWGIIIAGAVLVHVFPFVLIGLDR